MRRLSLGRFILLILISISSIQCGRIYGGITWSAVVPNPNNFQSCTLTYSWNPSADTWTTIGNSGFSLSAATYTSLAIDLSGTPYVVYSDGARGNKASVKNTTVQLGSQWAASGLQGIKLTILQLLSTQAEHPTWPSKIWMEQVKPR